MYYYEDIEMKMMASPINVHRTTFHHKISTNQLHIQNISLNFTI